MRNRFGLGLSLAQATTAWNALTEQERNNFINDTGLGQEEFVDMLGYNAVGGAFTENEGKNAFMAAAVFRLKNGTGDTVLKDWLMELFQSQTNYNSTWWHQTKVLQESGWRIEHGPALRHHGVRADKRIIIDEWRDREKSDYSEELRDTFNRSYQKDAIIHETGHAVSDVKIDTRSKEIFVAMALLDEGAAMLNYMIIQTEIRGVGMLEVSKTNFENKPDYKAIFKQYQQDGNADKARRAIAAIYADREIEPSTGKTYRQYYEDRYDEEYGSKRGTNAKQTSGPGRKKVR